VAGQAATTEGQPHVYSLHGISPATGCTFALQCFLRSGLPSCSCTGGTWPGEPVSRIQKVTLSAPANGWNPSLAPQFLQAQASGHISKNIVTCLCMYVTVNSVLVAEIDVTQSAPANGWKPCLVPQSLKEHIRCISTNTVTCLYTYYVKFIQESDSTLLLLPCRVQQFKCA
jgi:hypothetical protein